MMVTAKDIELVETCSASPEQYDAFYMGKQVGYLRYRFGGFTVECPDCLALEDPRYERVISEEVGDGMQGRFDDDVRDKYLLHAKEAIAGWVNRSPDSESGVDQ